MINNNIKKYYNIDHLENILSTLKYRLDEINKTIIGSKYTAEYKKSESDGFVRLYAEQSKYLQQLQEVDGIIKGIINDVLNYQYKEEQKKYTFLTIEQLKNIDRFVEDIFENRKNNGDIDFNAPLDNDQSIEDYQEIVLFYTRNSVTNEQTSVPKYECISIWDGEKLIKDFDISKLTKEDVRKLLKEKLNKIKIQCIQNAFANAKPIWQNPNIKQNSFNFSLLKFYKDIYKKKIKDRERKKQNKFYSKYAEIIKQNRIQPFYKVLDYRNRIKEHNKLTKESYKLIKQLDNLKQLDKAKKLKKNRIY